MTVIVQIAGIKRWKLWRPMSPSPKREYQESFRVWDPGFIPGGKPWAPTWRSLSGRVSPCSCRGGGSTIPTRSTPRSEASI
ncbi:hypothetical protein [Streptomyces microflavus]|uniref:hypothetical protein n=1 Tax=Streptomyces microflavus TaxID=1919 RepID=UPI00386EE407|nr:hypothetical protein OH770_13170 [Streptomyces microflavus]